jgi:predicted enzyme related to lactoylglutathione lyase
MAMTNTATLGKVQQIALVQHDVERATAFYRDALGLPLQFAMAGMAFFDAGGVRLMLTKPSSPEFDHRNSVLYFEVANCDAAYAELQGRGVPFDGPPHLVGKTGTHEMWMAFLRDPEGNVLAISEARPIA